MGAEEKGSHKERVEAMQKKFDVRLYTMDGFYMKEFLINIIILYTFCDLHTLIDVESVLHIYTIM